MKKVGFIIPALSGGGAERVASYLANGLSKFYEVTVYTITADTCTYALAEGVVHKHLSVEARGKISRVTKRFSKLVKMIENEDVIIAFDRNYGVTAGLKAKKKVIASERNDPYSNMSRHSFWKYYRDHLYRRASHVVFQTPYARDYFSGKIRAHSTIIENPIDDSIDIPYTGADSHTLIAACRLTEQKNIPMMLRAFELFSARHPDYELHICGEGPLKGEIEQQLAERGLADKVLLQGYVNDVKERMGRSLMYLSSSDYEGISNTMLEAMAVGMPVICTDCPAGGAKMSIEDGVNGLLVPVGDADAMADAMCRLVEDPALRASLGARAREVRVRFSQSAIVEKWRQVIESL